MVSGSRVHDNSSMDAAELNDAIAVNFPELPGLNLRAGDIADHVGTLFPEERVSIEKAIEKRQWEFATGRALARDCMEALQLPPKPVLRGEKREPIWPDNLQGSITHAERLAVSAVALDGALNSIGIDLEVAERVGEELFEKLFTLGELDRIHASDVATVQLAGMMFSAKEAGYKATYPLVGQFIGFKEAEVNVDWPTGRFTLSYVGAHQPNKVMEQAKGHFLFCERYVLSLVIIPRER
jgi:4'-phosphopantetheinyl transferase EntD